MKECNCSCKETKRGPEEWKGLTTFRIAELDIIRGLPGKTDISFTMAHTKEDAIKKYYESNPGASNRILIYSEGCATVHERHLKPFRSLK